MQKAAARLDFEKAAELRDMLQDMRQTTAPTLSASKRPSQPASVAARRGPGTRSSTRSRACDPRGATT